MLANNRKTGGCGCRIYRLNNRKKSLKRGDRFGEAFDNTDNHQATPKVKAKKRAAAGKLSLRSVVE